MKHTPIQSLTALALALASIASVDPAFAHDVSPPRAEADPAIPITPGKIDGTVARAMQAFQVPGMAVGIVKDGKVVFAKGYGVREAGKPDRVDADTLFQIGSNTKAFTATALAILVDEGKLRWDDKVIDHLPQFRMYDPYVTQQFTIRDLLTHRSGLGEGAGDLMFFPTTDLTRDEIIHGLRYLMPTSSFRSTYAYDNILYMVAGQLVPAITGQSWEDFVARRIFQPLQMTGCVPSYDRIADHRNIVSPHVVIKEQVQAIPAMALGVIGGAGTINCNIAGMSKWVETQLARGMAPSGQRLFSAERAEEMWTVVTPTPVSPLLGPMYNTHFSGYGLGWELSDADGHLRVHHTGGVPGSVTWVSMIPELNLGVLVFTNQQNVAAMESVGGEILDAYLGAKPQDWVGIAQGMMTARSSNAAKLVEAASKVAAAAPKPTLPLDAYAGTYHDAWRGDANVQRIGNKLVLKFSRTDELEGPLTPYSGNIFIVHWNNRSLDADAYVRFEQGFDGKVSGITLQAVSPTTDFSFDFQDLDFKKVRDVDLLIVRGNVYIGDTSPPHVEDVGIVGDKIVFMGDASTAGVRGKRTLNAKGLMVTPGLLDAHTHTDDELLSSDPTKRLVTRQVMQGITTSIIGVDGSGTPDIKAKFDKMEDMGVGQNVAAYVGFGAIRQRVLHDDAHAPTPVELQSMKSLAAKGMCEGAIGLSSGLFYAPQSFASTEEVIAVAKEAGKRGGLYDTHQRDEGDSSVGVMTSLQEALRIGQESGAPLHLAHIKVSGGPHSMGDLVEMIEAAQSKGQKVTADQYPWTAANTGLDAAVIPRWAQDGGREAMIRRLDNPVDLAKIRADTYLTPALAQAIMISGAAHQPQIVGKRLSELAAGWEVDPIDAAIRVLKGDDADVVVFVMHEPDIVKAMKEPWVMSSSDGADGGHPRGYASYARLWENYVVAQKILTPVRFVYRSTGFAADTLGLKGRGYIKLGYFADIAVIDPNAYHARATYAEPTLLSTGVVDVIVNGGIELEDEKPTGLLSGRALRKTPPMGTCP